MAGLPATGTLKYNGYEFEGASSATCQITTVYDDAGRVEIAQRYRLTVRAIITDETSLDKTMEEIREDLSVSGCPLDFVNRGFGDDIKIRADGKVQDIEGGPFPEVIDWAPVGDNRAAEIVWTVVFTLPLCKGGKTAKRTGVRAMNYEASYAINEHGDTTRVISGYLEIVVTAKATASDTADRYRDKFNAGALEGFTRTQEWRVNKKKNRLDFRITDTQIPSPNAWPQGVTAIQASHRFLYNRSAAGITKRNTISATISPRAGLSGALAWASFATLVGSRLAWATRLKQHPFIDSVLIDESIFGRETSFAVSYRLLAKLDQLLPLDAGLWQAIGTDWTRWRSSMLFGSNPIYGNRGHAKLGDLAANDVVVNLCSATDYVSPNNKQSIIPTRAPVVVTPKAKRTFTNEQPSAERSWTKYRQRVVPTRNRTTTKHRTIQEPLGEDNAKWNTENPSPATGQFSMETQSDRQPDVIQEDTAPSHTIAYIGEAERVGHKIPRPAVESVGGVPAREIAGSFILEDVGRVFGIPTYEAQWFLLYELEKSPGTIEYPKDKVSE